MLYPQYMYYLTIRWQTQGFYWLIAGEGKALSQLSKSLETESEPSNIIVLA